MADLVKENISLILKMLPQSSLWKVTALKV